jgi:hypothetical protein
MVKAIGHNDPSHFTQRIERGADVVGGLRWAVNPKAAVRESNDRRSCAQTDAAKPDRTFGYPDRVRYHGLKDVGELHGPILPSGDALILTTF